MDNDDSHRQGVLGLSIVLRHLPVGGAGRIVTSLRRINTLLEPTEQWRNHQQQ